MNLDAMTEATTEVAADDTDARRTVQAVELDALPSSASNPRTARALGERYDLVDHVRVKLMVKLGEAEVSVKDLFDLRDGCVVKLDRALDEPVDLMLDGNVVARGILVAAGEHFGVRIDQILA